MNQQAAFDQVIDRRSTHSLKWTRYAKDVLPLWVADMDFPAPEPVREALRGAIEHGVFGYEMPSRKLAATVADRMQALYGWEVSPEMVLATPGIVSGFNVAARAACHPGEGILVQPPVYHPFLTVPENTGTVLQLAPLQQLSGIKCRGRLTRGASPGKRITPAAIRQCAICYDIDWQIFRSAFNSNGARTAMFLLCHPHNPTGQIYTRAQLERMAELCLVNGTIICSDEIHSELLLGGARHTPMASLSPEIARRTITLVSASKTFNVVGFFCGFAIIPDEKLRRRYRQVLERLTIHVNSLGLLAAEAAFCGRCEAWLESLRRYLTGNRDFLLEFAAQKLPGVRLTDPQATYLAWMDFSELIAQGKIGSDPGRFLLHQAKVAVNPGAEFGLGGKTFVRLNFGCPRATLLEALERIRKAVSGPA